MANSHDLPFINVQVLQVVDAGCFWAKEAPGSCMTQEAEKFHELSQHINEHFNQDQIPGVQPKNKLEGEVFIGLRPSDKKWYRVVVSHVVRRVKCTEAQCYLVDYATKAQIPVRWLRVAPEAFLELPYQAKKMILSGIRPVTLLTSPIDLDTRKGPCDKWDTSAKEFVKHLFEVSTKRQVQIVRRRKDRLEVRLFMDIETSGRVCLNDKLVEDGYAMYLESDCDNDLDVSGESSSPDRDERMYSSPYSSPSSQRESPVLGSESRISPSISRSRKGVASEQNHARGYVSDDKSTPLRTKSVTNDNDHYMSDNTLVQQRLEGKARDISAFLEKNVCRFDNTKRSKRRVTRYDRLSDSEASLTGSSDQRPENLNPNANLSRSPLTAQCAGQVTSNTGVRPVSNHASPQKPASLLQMKHSQPVGVGPEYQELPGNLSQPSAEQSPENLSPRVNANMTSQMAQCARQVASDIGVANQISSQTPVVGLGRATMLQMKCSPLANVGQENRIFHSQGLSSDLSSKPEKTLSKIVHNEIDSGKTNKVVEKQANEIISHKNMYSTKPDLDCRPKTHANTNTAGLSLENKKSVFLENGRSHQCSIGRGSYIQRILDTSRPSSEASEAHDSALGNEQQCSNSLQENRHEGVQYVNLNLSQGSQSRQGAGDCLDAFSHNAAYEFSSYDSHPTSPHFSDSYDSSPKKIDRSLSAKGGGRGALLFPTSSVDATPQKYRGRGQLFSTLSQPSASLPSATSPRGSEMILPEQTPTGSFLQGPAVSVTSNRNQEQIGPTTQLSHQKELNNQRKIDTNERTKSVGRGAYFMNLTAGNKNQQPEVNVGRGTADSSTFGFDGKPSAKTKTSSPFVQFSDAEEVFSGERSPRSPDDLSKPLKSILKKSPSSGPVSAVLECRDEERDTEDVSALKLRGLAAGQRLLDLLGCDSLSDNKEQFDDSITPESLGVLLYSAGRAPKPVQRVTDVEVPFANLLKRAFLERRAIEPTKLQMFTWGPIIRGLHVIAVAPCRTSKEPIGGGKTMSYLPPLLSQLSDKSSYCDLPEGGGPIALIVCPFWRKVRQVYDQCKDLITKSRLNIQALCIFGGGNEDIMEIPLINGCDILCTTPCCLLRVLKREITNLHRLCHLVFEDTDILMEEFPEEMLQLRREHLTQRRCSKSTPMQQLVFSSQWSPLIESYAQNCMEQPLIVITSTAEAAIYGRVKQVPIICKSTRKTEIVLRQLTEPSTSEGQKIVIVTRFPKTAMFLHKSLKTMSRYSLLAYDDLDQFDLGEVLEEWSCHHEKDSTPVLVVTDAVLSNMDFNIGNASVVVHFDLPSGKSSFGKRLWCMHNNFFHPLRKIQEVNSLRSYLLLSEDGDAQAPYILDLLQRLEVEFPSKLREHSDRQLERREHGKNLPLCHQFKAYGKCRDETRCRLRHVINEKLDSPVELTSSFKVPTEGEVKVLVTHVNDAGCYQMQILEHKDTAGNVTKLTTFYLGQQFDLNEWYADEEDHRNQVYPVIDQWYAWADSKHNVSRVRVTKLSNVLKKGVAEEVQIHLFDTGGYMKVPTSDLWELPEQFKKTPPLAVEVYLCRIKPVDRDVEYTDKATELMAEKFHKKELRGRVVLSLGRTLWLDPLCETVHLKEIGVMSNSCFVRSLLLGKEQLKESFKENIAVENEEHLRQLYDACEQKLNIPGQLPPDKNAQKAYTMYGRLTNPPVATLPDNIVPVVVSSLENPDLIFVQLKDNISSMEDVENEINRTMELDNNSERLQEPRKHLLVLAKFPMDDR